MKKWLENNGWCNYQTGCSCQGRPRYFNNSLRLGVVIIVKGDHFTIRKGGVEVYKGESEEFEFKMKEYELA